MALRIFKTDFHNLLDGESKEEAVLLHTLEIPVYQRRYGWKRANIRSLIDDVEDCAAVANTWVHNYINDRNNRLTNGLEILSLFGKNVYLGNLVIINDDKRKSGQIVDGQQRIITFYLFLKFFQFELERRKNELKAFFKEQNNSELYKAVCETVLYRKLNPTDNYGKSRVFLETKNKKDSENLKKVLGSENWSDYYEKFKKSKSKKNRFWENIDTLKQEWGFSNDLEKLDVEKLIVRLCLVLKTEVGVTSIDDESRAYEIFEALNSRALELSATDLIKNLTFRLAEKGGDFDPAQSWDDLSTNFDDSNLTDAQNAARLTSFIRANLVQENGSYVKKKDLFVNVRKKIGSKKEFVGAEQMMAGLISSAKTWSEFKNSTDKWRLNAVEFLPEIYLPIVLWVAINEAKISTDLSIKIINYLLRQSFVHFPINNLPSKEIDKHIPKAIWELKQIEFNDPKVFEDQCKKILDKYIGNETLKNKDESDPDVQRVLLEPLLTMEFDERKDIVTLYELLDLGPKELMINWSSVQIEHMLPQNPKEWITLDGDFKDKDSAEEYLFRVGNIFALHEKHNKEASNYSYEKKIKLFQESGKSESSIILDIKNVFNKIPSKWGKSEIDTRCKWIVEKLQENLFPFWK